MSYIRVLDPSKATGVDGLGPKIIMLAANSISNFIATYKFGNIPKPLSFSVQKYFLFSKLFQNQPHSNYRPISIPTTISKIFEKLLQQGYRYHKLRKPFSKFYRRHYELISKYNVGLKTLLSEGLSEPEFYGDLVYKFKKLIGINDFSFQFRKIRTRYRRIG